jgi:hypothetical protein
VASDSLRISGFSTLLVSAAGVHRCAADLEQMSPLHASHSCANISTYPAQLRYLHAKPYETTAEDRGRAQQRSDGFILVQNGPKLPRDTDEFNGLRRMVEGYEQDARQL